MRNNQPVTSVGRDLKDGEVIVSRTDAKGVITYVNDPFVSISGYTREELLGQPHNLVRHPDVPPAAFADLWETIKAGKSWRGVVKNRCKSGDYYWVEANVAPYYQEGVQQGYVSIRTRPTDNQISEAERAYQRMKEGKGESPFGKLAQRLKNATIKTRLIATFAFLTALMLGVTFAGLHGMSSSNRKVEEVYSGNLVPVTQLAKINSLMRQNLQTLTTAIIARSSPENTHRYIAKVETNIAEISILLEAFLKGDLSLEERKLADEWVVMRKVFVEKGLTPAISTLKAGEFSDAEDIVLGVAVPRYEKAQVVFEKLVEKQVELARLSNEQAMADYAATRNLLILAALVGLALAGVIGYRTIRAIVRPLEAARSQMDKMSHGDLTTRIDVGGQDEVGQVVNSLQRLQMRFVYVINDIVAVMGKVARGDLDARVEAGSEGLFLQLKNNINESLARLDGVLVDIGSVADGLASGKFDRRVTAEAGGQLGALKRDINQSLQQLETVLSEIGGVMDGVAEGDLGRRVNAQASGQLGELKENLNRSLVRLGGSLKEVLASTRQVASASSETGTAIGQISDGAQNQMHAINQVTGAIREVSVSVGEISRNTEVASQNARAAVEAVTLGQSKMSHMVEVVNSIAANSEKINKITEVIEKIANKTNLLSLNAAIEAARAGEHGKGFAVVAEEVGKLAANSAESTQEIAQLVHQAVAEANRAVATVKEVSADMDNIRHTSAQSDAMLSQVAAAVEEQSASLQAVNNNVENLNRIAEGNAAASEEITATVVELSKIADGTRREVEKFKM